MQQPLLPAALVSAILLIMGCSKKVESIPEVEKILAATETSISQRTPEWYASQEEITSDVIKTCVTYFIEKADRLGGKYQDELNSDLYGKFQEIPDCLNARKGEIINMGKSKVQLTQDQLKNIETELQKPDTIQHINKVAEDVASKLNQQDQQNSEADKHAQEEFIKFLNENQTVSEPKTNIEN